MTTCYVLINSLHSLLAVLSMLLSHPALVWSVPSSLEPCVPSLFLYHSLQIHLWAPKIKTRVLGSSKVNRRTNIGAHLPSLVDPWLANHLAKVTRSSSGNITLWEKDPGNVR